MKPLPPVLCWLAGAVLTLSLIASQGLRAEVRPARSALEAAPRSILWLSLIHI